MISFLQFCLICFFSSLALAHDDMDMDGMGMGGMGGGSMKMYLHFTPGDSVLFGPWIPQTDRAIFGTCVGVFMLAMVDRWFSATAAVMNAYWHKK
jgi:copper transporter 1